MADTILTVAFWAINGGLLLAGLLCLWFDG